MKVLGISGSLRKESFNHKALVIALRFALEEGAEIAEANLRELTLPLYDGDIEAQGYPESVINFKRMVEKADMLVIASPEYNHSVSGAMKNAIDWLSRSKHGEKNSLAGKTAVLMSASDGNYGGARMQPHLRQILAALNVMILPYPQLLIRNADKAFTPEGDFAEEKIAAQAKTLIQKTLALTKQLKA